MSGPQLTSVAGRGIRPVLINGSKAAAKLDPVTGTYRGEFPGLNGQADFYAACGPSVLAEGRRSLG
jgi:predicted HicB family RNase H-like nuclease